MKNIRETTHHSEWLARLGKTGVYHPFKPINVVAKKVAGRQPKLHSKVTDKPGGFFTSSMT